MARSRQPKKRTFTIDPHSVEVRTSYGRSDFTLEFNGGTWQKPKRVLLKFDSDTWLGEIGKKLHEALKKRETAIAEQRKELVYGQ